MTGPMDPISAFRARIPDADPRIYVVVEGWCQARKGALVPKRGDLDPVSIAGALGDVFIYRYHPDRGDYVCELAGEHVNDAWGRSIKGQTLRQVVMDTDHPTVLERWELVRSVPLIQYGTAAEQLAPSGVRYLERMILPLVSHEGLIDTVLGVSLYASWLDRADLPPMMPQDVVHIPCSDI